MNPSSCLLAPHSQHTCPKMLLPHSQAPAPAPSSLLSPRTLASLSVLTHDPRLSGRYPPVPYVLDVSG